MRHGRFLRTYDPTRVRRTRGGTAGAGEPGRGRLAREHALRNQTPLAERGWLHDPPNARDLAQLGLGLRASGQGWCGDDDVKNVVVWTVAVHLCLLTNVHITGYLGLCRG